MNRDKDVQGDYASVGTRRGGGLGLQSISSNTHLVFISNQTMLILCIDQAAAAVTNRNSYECKYVCDMIWICHVNMVGRKPKLRGLVFHLLFRSVVLFCFLFAFPFPRSRSRSPRKQIEARVCWIFSVHICFPSSKSQRQTLLLFQQCTNILLFIIIVYLIKIRSHYSIGRLRNRVGSGANSSSPRSGTRAERNSKDSILFL